MFLNAPYTLFSPDSEISFFIEKKLFMMCSFVRTYVYMSVCVCALYLLCTIRIIKFVSEDKKIKWNWVSKKKKYENENEEEAEGKQEKKVLPFLSMLYAW